MVIGLVSFVAGACFGTTSLHVDTKTTEFNFKTFDGYPMFGKLVLPATSGPHSVVIYVQTSEGMTVDMKRPLTKDQTFNYFDLYRTQLPKMNVGFFSYEGRGIAMGDAPPRYEKIDRTIYDTSTLDNKVHDAISAVELVRKQPGVDPKRIYLMGASEGTLLAVEAASRIPKEVAGLVLYGVLTTNMRENFKYILSDGAFLPYRLALDKDDDAKVSKAEFGAVSKTGWDRVDPNGDGYFTVEDMRVLTKKYIEAVDHEDFGVLDAWATTNAAVATPKGWFKDHFAHKPMWDFMSKLTIPVGCFQGNSDAMANPGGVKSMEEKARVAKKTNFEFHYFDGLDHSLNIGKYFVNGTIPPGHAAIFEFIKKLSTSK